MKTPPIFLAVLASVAGLSASRATGGEPAPLRIPLGAYRIENPLLETADDFCVTDETNRLLSAAAWKAHFATKGMACAISDERAPEPHERTWKGACKGVVLGRTVETGNEVRVLLIPETKGFVVSTKSTGDVPGHVAVSGKPAGACSSKMLVYKPWG